MKKILILIATLLALNTGTAYAAPSCAESLGIFFTAAQRVQLCKTFGSAVSASLIPVTSNTFDLGSAALPWRTLYTGTSRIALTSDILRVRQDAQRLFTWDGSSDTALTMTFGDGGTTAAQVLTVSGSTADADDDSSLILTGGGAYSTYTRGATVAVYGNEVATVGGFLDLFGGGVSGADVRLRSEDDFIFQTTTGTEIAALTELGALNLTGAGGVNLSTSGATLSLQEATAGSKCMGTLTANGATPVVTATTCAKTASRIFMQRTSAETGTVNAWISAIVDATSFAITSEAADTGTYNWFIINESA